MQVKWNFAGIWISPCDNELHTLGPSISLTLNPFSWKMYLFRLYLKKNNAKMQLSELCNWSIPFLPFFFPLCNEQHFIHISGLEPGWKWYNIHSTRLHPWGLWEEQVCHECSSSKQQAALQIFFTKFWWTRFAPSCIWRYKTILSIVISLFSWSGLNVSHNSIVGFILSRTCLCQDSQAKTRKRSEWKLSTYFIAHKYDSDVKKQEMWLLEWR